MSELPAGFEVETGLPAGFEVIAPQSGISQELTGVPKQVGAGLIESAAAVPGATPSALKWIGSQVSRLTGLPEPAPITNAPPTPDQQISSALPPPQNEGEDIARNIGGSALGGLFAKGHLAENLVGGIGAGLGAHYAPQIASDYGLTPTEGAIGGALAGGFAGAHSAGNVANMLTRGAMPKPQQILQATSDAYDALRMDHRQIVVPQQAMYIIKNGALNLLNAAGPAEESAKKVYSIINGLDGNSAGNAAILLNARKNLTAQFHGGPDANKPAAILALQALDAGLKQIVPPGTMETLRGLDTNWSAARTAQALDAKISQGESGAKTVNSGMNTGNKILQNIESYIKSRTDVTGKVHMNPQDLAALQSVKPGTGQAIERFMGSGGGGLGGLSIMGMAGGLTAAGINNMGKSATDSADPLISGIGLPLLGLGARYGFNRSIVRAAKNAEAQILSRAPYMTGVSIPRGLLSAPQVAGRSLLFAAPAIRDNAASPAQ